MEILNKRITDFNGWEYALFAISIVYLLIEFNLNAQILNAIDNPEIAIELEGYGRLVASFGAMLFVSRFITNNKVYAFIAWMVIAGASTYIAQKGILDYLVEDTTDTERKAAQHLVLLQRSLLSNVSELPDLNKDISNDEVSYKAFTAMLAFTSRKNADHLAVVKDHMPEVLTYQVDKEIDEKLPEKYDDFVHAMETKLVDGYREISGNRRKLEQGIERLVGKKHHDINKFFRSMKRCGFDRECQKTYEHFYRKAIIEYLGQYLPWQELCRRIEYKEMISTASGLRTEDKVEYECAEVGVVELERRLKKAVGLSESEKEITFQEFYRSPMVQKALRDALNISNKEQFVDPNMSFQEFVDLVRGTAQKTAVNQELEKIELPVSQLDNKGKNFVKAVMVVPFALAVSLIFSIANFTFLTSTVVKKLHQYAGRFENYEQHSKHAEYIKHAAPVIGISLLLGAFLMAPSNGVVHGGWGMLIEFVIEAESAIFPIGNIFNIKMI